jgi:hypothetical protein
MAYYRQQSQTTTMQPDTRYLNLLKKAGLTVEQMADQLSSMGIGTPQQWRHTLTTGQVGHFSKEDGNTAQKLIEQNQHLIGAANQIMRSA